MALRSSIFSVNSLKKLSGKYATLLRHAQLKFDIFFCPLKTLIFLGYDSDFQLHSFEYLLVNEYNISSKESLSFDGSKMAFSVFRCVFNSIIELVMIRFAE
jgi:hypothetical protein